MMNNQLEPNIEPAGSWVFDTKQCCEYPAMIEYRASFVLGIQFTKAEYTDIYEYLASSALRIQLHIMGRITKVQVQNNKPRLNIELAGYWEFKLQKPIVAGYSTLYMELNST